MTEISRLPGPVMDLWEWLKERNWADYPDNWTSRIRQYNQNGLNYLTLQSVQLNIGLLQDLLETFAQTNYAVECIQA